MGLNYTTFVSEIATITAITSSVLVNGDNNFGPIMGGLINYSEGLIYRDLNLPVVSVIDTAATCSSGVRSVNLSTTQGEPLVLDSLNLLVPIATGSSVATRVPLVATSKAVLDAVYPSGTSSNTAQPEFFVRTGNLQCLLGPTPDQAYGTEAYFTVRPPPLSASNSSTWLSQNYPELMVAAGMIFAAGYMRDFGSQSDDPKLAQSWKGQYDTLLRTARIEVDQMNFEGPGWTSQDVAPIATPPRP